MGYSVGEEIRMFLDETDKIDHSKTKARLIQINFGLSREMSHHHVEYWKEFKNVK